MPSRAKHDRQSLQAHGIYLRDIEDIDTSPVELQDLFKLIQNVRDLKSDRFGGYETSTSDPSLVSFHPRQQCEKELKQEAEKLADNCMAKRRPDDSENKWVATLEPIVFYRFDQEQEEKYARERHHHCFICRKHYPLNSRPLISRTSARTIEMNVGKWSEDSDENLCELTSKEHFNLPNFDTIDQLAYPKFEDEEKKIPDLTIGLRTYDLAEWSRTEDAGLLLDDRVRMFDQNLLGRLEVEEVLIPPFIRTGSSGFRVRDPAITFPFGFWEAKRPGGGYDHQSAQKQNALKVKMILSWQNQVAKHADIPWSPLAWYFVSVGSDWKVYGCHFEQNSIATDGRICVLKTLWSGSSHKTDEALQLLYIIDIIALWGEHKYKPFAAASIRRLKATLDKEAVPPLEDTLLAHQMEINSDNFPWLFPEREDAQRHAAFQIASPKTPGRPRSHSQLGSQQSPQLLPEIENLSLTASQRDYTIPERDCFIWLLDRGRKYGDLVIIRVDENGFVLPPLLIFESSDWEQRDFRYVIKEEQRRMPDNASTDFRVDENGCSYIERCVAANPGYFRKPLSHQFCAILPLDYRRYKRQIESASAEDTAFKSLESSLGLPQLIKAAQRANDKWCQCQAVYNEYSPSMILCDNLRCPMGWYHKKCVELDEDEDFTNRRWVCKKCLSKWHGNEYAKLKGKEIDDEIREASDARIQRVRTFSRVWKTHYWPNPRKLHRLIDRTSCRININEKRTCNTIKKVNSKDSDETRCWAILRSNPEIMMTIRASEDDMDLENREEFQLLKHRKSDCNVSRAPASSDCIPGRSSNLLSVPRQSLF